MAGFTERASARIAERLEPLARGAHDAASDPPVKSARTTVVIGRLLGAAFLICFATGIYSHLLQNPLPWLPMPARPVSLYRVTQGLHVIAGTAAVPLLLAKLWSVYPRLFAWPPVRSVGHALERASIAVLVGVSLVEVTIGLLNLVQWYVFPFPFRATHFALAWVLIGALAIHLGVKLPVIVRVWRRDPRDRPDAPGRTVTRRGFVRTVGTAAASAVLLTAGQSVPVLAPFNALAPRRMGVGPQGLPINRTAAQAGVTETAVAPDWVLTVASPAGSRDFTLDELRALPQTEAVLPIACVEGWSQSATWRGVRLVDLLAEADAGEPNAPVGFESLQERGAFARTEMPPHYARDPLTLVALELNGGPLHVDHGFPARLIAPGRPGVMQTKWLRRIEVTA
ncbi:molybdopterin-dependent oxidoreductase [Agromyces marinus]|uniref:Molybdopterin-binding protein n=1 Tax=Agromyces marinus TaxID=1389020 RepID=A0ABM8H182_9MICO|nr:molybdopterin-dependent oxidoreductase [Agromyces marinus]UIP57362.1 Protein-methionine-sulfoxide reductase catalytic subunit MsrP [Agromyces marinus]BDZ54530.1 molybdopterin-binding protein [Agromyces marinus]